MDATGADGAVTAATTTTSTATTAAMPATDWLTGLASRAAFGRQLTQIDRDRDQAARAVLELVDVDEVNRRFDYETGDDLLRAIGDALAPLQSVDTVTARLGGAQFAVLTVERFADDLRTWAAPIVGAVTGAIGRWAFEQIDHHGGCPIQPELRVGVATGSSTGVWADAESALGLARADGGPSVVVVHDPADPRIVAAGRRRAEADRVALDLAGGRLAMAWHRIEALGGPDPDRRWLRLGVAAADGSVLDSSVLDGSVLDNGVLDGGALSPGLERRLETWLVEQAGGLVGEADGQLRVTVPVAHRVCGGASAAQRLFGTLERERIPPSRVLFEIGEAALLAGGRPAGDFVRRLDRIGSGVVVAGYQGGWAPRLATEDLPILHLQPHHRLVDRAVGGDPAAIAILATVESIATADEQTLIAPLSAAPDAALRRLGFAYREDRTTRRH